MDINSVRLRCKRQRQSGSKYTHRTELKERGQSASQQQSTYKSPKSRDQRILTRDEKEDTGKQIVIGVHKASRRLG